MILPEPPRASRDLHLSMKSPFLACPAFFYFLSHISANQASNGRCHERGWELNNLSLKGKNTPFFSLSPAYVQLKAHKPRGSILSIFAAIMAAESLSLSYGKIGTSLLVLSYYVFGFPTLPILTLYILITWENTDLRRSRARRWSLVGLHHRIQLLSNVCMILWCLRSRYEIHYIWPNAYTWLYWLAIFPVMVMLKIKIFNFIFDSNGWIQPVVYIYSISRVLPSWFITSSTISVRLVVTASQYITGKISPGVGVYSGKSG